MSPYKKRKSAFLNGFVLAVRTAGGWLLSLTGMPLAWMLGSMMATLLFTIYHNKDGTFSKKWRIPAELLVAVHLGHQGNGMVFMQVMMGFGWILAGIALLVISSILIGFMVWKLSGSDPVTSLFGMVPGGATEMSVIAEELGGQAILYSLSLPGESRRWSSLPSFFMQIRPL